MIKKKVQNRNALNKLISSTKRALHQSKGSLLRALKLLPTPCPCHGASSHSVYDEAVVMTRLGVILSGGSQDPTPAPLLSSPHHPSLPITARTL
ncbi:hypothetical protein E2C01_049343 [Portunus trituberculatus]|uniref:Uncharacterized protein n=1 Tax=Portunus trituberculatus TaxID=210409 RepID=A0A5B7GE62_PORTR|nr:hypothetical protein [Portunus trituberculatus]